MVTDEQLMEFYAATGDARAFGVLYARYVPLVRRVVQRQGSRGSEVDDIAQQTFMKLHAARGHYQRGARLKPWLCAIAVNASRDHRRRERRRPEVHAELEEMPDPGPVARDTELTIRPSLLAAAVDGLPHATRQLFRLHFWEERSLTEIARGLDEKPGTVRVRLHRGCRRLQAELRSQQVHQASPSGERQERCRVNAGRVGDHGDGDRDADGHDHVPGHVVRGSLASPTT